MWQRIKALCFHSLTMAWGYFLAVTGALMQNLDDLAAAVGDPSLKQQISDLVHADAVIMGRVVTIISIITLSARLRSIVSKKSQ